MKVPIFCVGFALGVIFALGEVFGPADEFSIARAKL
jgi:hypothetical protein